MFANIDYGPAEIIRIFHAMESGSGRTGGFSTLWNPAAAGPRRGKSGFARRASVPGGSQQIGQGDTAFVEGLADNRTGEVGAIQRPEAADVVGR